MKKALVICLFIFIGAIVFCCSYYYSKENLGLDNHVDINETEDDYGKDDFRVLDEEIYSLAANEEILINNLTTIRLQEMYLPSTTFSEEIINTPVKFLGMNRNDLVEYLKLYMENPNKEDLENGLIAYELVQFTRKEVVIRKTYQNGGTDFMFKAVDENNYVVIYNARQNTIYDYTSLNCKLLPEELQKQLKTGIFFETIKELYEFLETYSS